MSLAFPCQADDAGANPFTPYAGQGQVCPPNYLGSPPTYRPPFGWPPDPRLYAPPQWTDSQPTWPSASSPQSDDATSPEQPEPSPYGDQSLDASPFSDSSTPTMGLNSGSNSSPQSSSRNSYSNSTVSPNMIGDLIGLSQPGGIILFDPLLPRGPGNDVAFEIPGGLIGAAPGANVGRQKFTENGNPVPHDRVWMDYSFFDQTRLYPGGVDVHRGVFGFERTLFSPYTSIEVRVPFASTLNSELFELDGVQLTGRATELGNLTLFGKAMLTTSQYHTLGVGLGLTLPTANDVTITEPPPLGPGPAGPAFQVLEVRNESFHVLPYIGGSFTPIDRLFLNWIVQLDIDANGNEARVFDVDLGGYDVRDVLDSNYLFVDVSLGCWIFRRQQSGSFGNASLIDGMAAIFEVHQNEAIGNPDELVGRSYESSPLERLSTTNLTFGLTTLIGRNSTLTTAIVTPVDGNEQFDREFRLIYDYRF